MKRPFSLHLFRLAAGTAPALLLVCVGTLIG